MLRGKEKVVESSFCNSGNSNYKKVISGKGYRKSKANHHTGDRKCGDSPIEFEWLRDGANKDSLSVLLSLPLEKKEYWILSIREIKKRI